MVPTSHDVLGNTGLKTGFWLEEFRGPLLCIQGRWCAADPRVAERWATAPRSEERFTRKSNARHDAVQAGPDGAKGSVPDGQACRC